MPLLNPKGKEAARKGNLDVSDLCVANETRLKSRIRMNLRMALVSNIFGRPTLIAVHRYWPHNCSVDLRL